MNILETITKQLLEQEATYEGFRDQLITYSTFEQRVQARMNWLSATTFEQMCELTAQFIERKSPFVPGYCRDQLANDSTGIAESLAKLNRLGFLTTDSQPGLFDKPVGWEQRAYVDGFTSKEIASKLSCANSRFDLKVQVFEPATIELPITEDQINQLCKKGFKGKQLDVSRTLARRVHTRSGRDVSAIVYYHFGHHCSPKAMQALISSCYVSVIDRKWRRNSLLWDTVLYCASS